jgi:hypothetical protein
VDDIVILTADRGPSIRMAREKMAALMVVVVVNTWASERMGSRSAQMRQRGEARV